MVVPVAFTLSDDIQFGPIASVDGWPINIANEAQAIQSICAAASNGESFATFTLNLDHLVKLRRDGQFRDAYRNARFVTADGAPIAFLAARTDARVCRTSGADLVEPLAEEAARRNLPVYLFGSSAAVLEGVSEHLATLTKGRIKIVGAVSPPQGFDPTGTEADLALERIRASGARLCIVALGAPKQELFAAKATGKGVPGGFVGVGAALDFLVGHQTRAPQWMQRAGIEWIWRLASNPRRLTQRYVDCAIILIELLVLQPIKARVLSLIKPPRSNGKIT